MSPNIKPVLSNDIKLTHFYFIRKNKMYTKEQLQKKGLHNYNLISGRFYLGLGNQLALKSKGFSSLEWVTFYQAKQTGLRIKKGSKGIDVIYENIVPVGEFVDGELVEKPVHYKRVHRVFNIEQTEKVLTSKETNYVSN